MKVALYGRPIKYPNFQLFFERFVTALNANDINYETTQDYGAFLKKQYGINHPTCTWRCFTNSKNNKLKTIIIWILYFG